MFEMQYNDSIYVLLQYFYKNSMKVADKQSHNITRALLLGVDLDPGASVDATFGLRLRLKEVQKAASDWCLQSIKQVG